ncbi:MAG: NIPSNAP family protein [Caldilineaceae bacterium]|nr:NIPSNAP family protein [Caldilineaceae bacterium]MCB9138000.1 NIPSNAP family protein [Caldilineaceae bacterium]
MFTCVIRYEVRLDRLEEFRAYAHAWIGLIERYGGTHHGYFAPDPDAQDMPAAAFSFPGLGEAAPPNAGYALFSFPDVESYTRYRADVAIDPDCITATNRFQAAPCFTRYERSFLRPIFDKESS